MYMYSHIHFIFVLYLACFGRAVKNALKEIITTQKLKVKTTWQYSLFYSALGWPRNCRFPSLCPSLSSVSIVSRQKKRYNYRSLQHNIRLCLYSNNQHFYSSSKILITLITKIKRCILQEEKVSLHFWNNVLHLHQKYPGINNVVLNEM